MCDLCAAARSKNRCLFGALRTGRVPPTPACKDCAARLKTSFSTVRNAARVLRFLALRGQSGQSAPVLVGRGLDPHFHLPISVIDQRSVPFSLPRRVHADFRNPQATRIELVEKASAHIRVFALVSRLRWDAGDGRLTRALTRVADIGRCAACFAGRTDATATGLSPDSRGLPEPRKHHVLNRHGADAQRP
jgi:hypothetical protein